MPIEAINADADVLARFRRLIAAKRLAHAYLFTGPEGTGKGQTALTMAQLVNCMVPAKAPCGECEQCRKIAARNHPDVHWVGVQGEDSVKLDEIRQALGRAGLRAFEGATKVFIFPGAERMTTEAANALLKTLEEPAPNTLMILTTAVPENCLDTIKSRCHAVRFFSRHENLPADKEKILDQFLARNGSDDFLKDLSTDRCEVEKAMLVLFSFWRDVMLFKGGADAKTLVFAGRSTDIQRLSQRDLGSLEALGKQIVRVKSLSGDNLNVKMALSLVKERIWAN